MNFLESLQDAHVKKLRLLKNQEGPFADTHYLVEGMHLIEHAILANVLESVYFTEKSIAFPKTVKKFQCTDHVMNAISLQKTPQGLIGLCRKKRTDFPIGHTIVYLDQINDPGNVGTILRTSLGLGISTVIFSANTANRYHPKVIASSQGAIFSLNLLDESEPFALLKQFQQEGFQVVTSALTIDATPLSCYPFQEKTLLVVGNESHGVREEIMNLSEGKVMIPMVQIDSLNVAVAFAIIAYHRMQNHRVS